MRAGLPVLALLIAGCSSGEEQADALAPGASGNPVAQCAVGGARALEPVCELEFAQQGDTRVLVVWHPDGSFRRFLVLPDGGGVEAADGADRAQVALVTDGLQVVVGSDRYVLPANVRSDGAE